MNTYQAHPPVYKHLVPDQFETVILHNTITGTLFQIKPTNMHIWNRIFPMEAVSLYFSRLPRKGLDTNITKIA